LSRRATAPDVRSDYDFLQRRPERLDAEAAVVVIDGVEVDLNDVPDAVPRPAARASRRANRPMTKKEFVARVAERSGLSKKDAEDAVNAVIATIEDSLKSGDDVNFTGFGKFHVAERRAREGRDPRTGESITISASRVPRFTAGSAFKRRVG
jgi:DNA-binding protein HU-beta